MGKYKMIRLKDSGRVKEVSRRAAALTVPVADLAAAAREGMMPLLLEALCRTGTNGSQNVAVDGHTILEAGRRRN